MHSVPSLNRYAKAIRLKSDFCFYRVGSNLTWGLKLRNLTPTTLVWITLFTSFLTRLTFSLFLKEEIGFSTAFPTYLYRKLQRQQKKLPHGEHDLGETHAHTDTSLTIPSLADLDGKKHPEISR